MKDKILTCVQCGSEFYVTSKEAEKLCSCAFNFPKRCPDCRRNKSKGIHEDNNDWRGKGKKRNKMRTKRYEWE